MRVPLIALYGTVTASTAHTAGGWLPAMEATVSFIRHATLLLPTPEAA
jgi:hypothetical protein